MVRYMVVVAGPGCGEIRYAESRAVMVGRERASGGASGFKSQLCANMSQNNQRRRVGLPPGRDLFGCYLWSRGGRTLQRVCGIVREAKVRGLYCYASFSFPLCKYGYHPTH